MRTGQIIRLILKRHLILVAALCISACATTNTAVSNSEPDTSQKKLQASAAQALAEAPIAMPEPAEPAELSEPEKTPTLPAEIKPLSEPVPPPEPDADLNTDAEANLVATQEPEDIPTPAGSFSNLSLWSTADPTPALKAFQSTCKIWKRRPDKGWLNSDMPKFGQYKDWRGACSSAMGIQANRSNAVRYFQSHFEPVKVGEETEQRTGLLTAYYAPEIPVRRTASLEFSEPILARPKAKKIQLLPRKDLSVTSSTVLAYGKPIDVFFLQIQGSGQIRFPDGKVYRAAFDGHNGHPYSSIGRVLIARGEMTKDQASKQSIEAWMEKEGYTAAKDLMAENARYVFFKTEHLGKSAGPKGAMGIALTPMGSLAVDPKHYPYGAVVWVEGKFPNEGGDYTGADAGHLLIAQDTGGAIKGKKRGDVYFGSGDAAGEKAGVMKHRATWTLFLPVALALKFSLKLSPKLAPVT